MDWQELERVALRTCPSHYDKPRIPPASQMLRLTLHNLTGLREREREKERERGRKRERERGGNVCHACSVKEKMFQRKVTLTEELCGSGDLRDEDLGILGSW